MHACEDGGVPSTPQMSRVVLVVVVLILVLVLVLVVVVEVVVAVVVVVVGIVVVIVVVLVFVTLWSCCVLQTCDTQTTDAHHVVGLT